jgi:hypothetical protein
MLWGEGPHSTFCGVYGYLFVVGGEGKITILFVFSIFEIIWVYVKDIDGPFS